MDAAICCTVTRATLGMSSESSLPVPPWRELAKWKQNATAMPPSTGAETRRPPRTLRVYTTHSSSARKAPRAGALLRLSFAATRLTRKAAVPVMAMMYNR